MSFLLILAGRKPAAAPPPTGAALDYSQPANSMYLLPRS